MIERETSKLKENDETRFVKKYGEWLSKQVAAKPLLQKFFDLKTFLANSTHGISHSAHVRNTMKTITQGYLDPQEEASLDSKKLDLLALFHDSGRQARFTLDDKEGDLITASGLTKREKRIRKTRQQHQIGGAALMKIACQGDPNFDYLAKSARLILSHDYHSPALTPKEPKPETIEEQILTAADKTSINPKDEVIRRYRYLTERPHKPVPFFDPDFSLEERKKWSFDQDCRDACCAIFAIFSYNPHHVFSHQGIRQSYLDWSGRLGEAKEELRNLADKNNVSFSRIEPLIESLRISS